MFFNTSNTCEHFIIFACITTRFSMEILTKVQALFLCRSVSLFFLSFGCFCSLYRVCLHFENILNTFLSNNTNLFWSQTHDEWLINNVAVFSHSRWKMDDFENLIYELRMAIFAALKSHTSTSFTPDVVISFSILQAVSRLMYLKVGIKLQTPI